MSKSERSTHWATILYPESCNLDYEKILKALKIPCAISPLHDRDVIEETGEIKKPHYHLVLSYSSLKSRKQAEADFELLGGVGVERVRDIRAYTRYLIHADDEEKAQYSIDDIITINGFDVEQYFRGKKSNLDEDYKKVVRMILDRGIKEYSELVEYCLENEPDLISVCRRSAYSLQAFIKSRRFSDVSKARDEFYKKQFNVIEALKQGFMLAPGLNFEQLTVNDILKQNEQYKDKR